MFLALITPELEAEAAACRHRLTRLLLRVGGAVASLPIVAALASLR